MMKLWFQPFPHANISLAGKVLAVAQVLVRDLDSETVERLKERARQHRRSLQAEAKAILQEAASMFTAEEALANSRAWHRRLAGRRHSDSAALIREDRDR